MTRYPKYKKTGISWLPEIPAEWEMLRFRHIATSMQKGSGITKEEVDDCGDTPCVRYGEIYTKYDGAFSTCLSRTNAGQLASSRYFSYGDILFSCTGELVEEIGKNVVYTGCERCLAGGDIVIASHRQNPIFLNYYLNCNNAQLQKSFGKSKLKVVHISAREIGNIVVPLPSESEQCKIASFLDDKCGKIDKVVAAKENEIGLLKELKQTEIADAVTRGISAAPLVNSGIPWLPKIPKGWKAERIGAFFTNEIASNKEFAYKRAFKFNYGNLVPKNEIGAPEEYKEVYVKYSILKQGDIVINGLNLNYDFVSQRVACSPSEGIITSAYIVCRPRKNVNYEFFTWLIKSMDNKKMFHGMGKGIRLTLSFSEVRKQVVPVPPLAEQKKIVSYIEKKVAEIDAAVKGLEEEVAALKEYKQRLISDVVTGQVRV